jgi:multiple sugar transport system permease protein
MSTKNQIIESARQVTHSLFHHDRTAGKITHRQLGYLLVLPTLLTMALLVVFPLAYSIYLGFHTATGVETEPIWVGLDNYIQIYNSSEFWTSFSNNMIWAIGTLTIQIVLGVSIALLLNRDFRGRNIARGAVLFPYMVPTIVGVFIFRWMFNSTYGVINYILVAIPGIIDAPISFFSADLAMFTAVLLGVWRFTPFVIIVVLARLQTIPQGLYESAKIDGAYRFAQFRYVTLPQLYNILIIVILLRGVWMLYMFDVIWMLTEGGPGTSSQILPVYAYREAFVGLNFGYGTAIANVMFVGLIICGFLYLNKFHKSEDEHVQN